MKNSNLLPCLDFRNWPQTVDQARIIQDQLRKKVITKDRFKTLTYIGGVDVSYHKRSQQCVAAIVIMKLLDLHLLDQNVTRETVSFPYIPGYLSFREIPPILNALKGLQIIPDLIVCDGQGIAHPRNFGLASHLGTLLDIPTIGIAKSKLVGYHEQVGSNKGDWQPLIYRDKVVGRVLRTRTRVKPVYISPGHKISLETATQLTLRITPKYRLPETTRLAHNLSKSYSNKLEEIS